ncbi:RDD family protein [Neolewinella litorea]|uniref:RDD family protein n=1 Tax=Neolewinella litorea TaxID=2562452 RepID=A0A4S4NQV7_9BACT|nr:RDD family protein [Neolewinella litorea]THH41557.1 RDD family protein [Neolewinella litorea]
MTSQALQDLPDPTTVPTAGFLPRLAAAIVDFFVLSPLLYGIYYFMVERPFLAGIVIMWLLQFVYKPLTEAYFGATAGKALMRLRVVNQGTNQNMSLNQSLIRYLPWAVSGFITLFVYIRIFQSPGFSEVNDVWEYSDFLNSFPLTDNFLVSLGNNFPTFSAVWMFMDPWNRALHDRWAQTFVIVVVPPVEE